MIKAKLSFKITTPSNVITNNIKKALSKNYDNVYNKLNLITQEISNFLYDAFLNSDTYKSLQNGELRAEFGLSDFQLNSLYEVIYDIIGVSTEIIPSANKKQFLKLNITFIDENFDPTTTGYFVTKKNDKIHWLYWLLYEGTSTVVPDHFVLFKQGAGRSGMAVMIQKSGSSYSVDPDFAGVDGDNWITRTILSNKKEITNIIGNILNGP